MYSWSYLMKKTKFNLHIRRVILNYFSHWSFNCLLTKLKGFFWLKISRTFLTKTTKIFLWLEAHGKWLFKLVIRHCNCLLFLMYFDRLLAAVILNKIEVLILKRAMKLCLYHRKEAAWCPSLVFLFFLKPEWLPCFFLLFCFKYVSA